MTEQQLQDAVIAAAQLLGWSVTHFRAARTTDGWRTPVAGDAAGFPDLILVRADDLGGRVAFAELKSDRGRVTDAQEAWLDRLRACPPAEVYVWRPIDWTSGIVERVLRERPAA